MRKKELSFLEKTIGYKFKNKDLLKKALTHSSYAYENIENNIEDNETLEFLGDTILDFIVAEYLYQNFPELLEGEMSKLKSSAVSASSLFNFAKKINLGKYLFLGKGEEKGGGRKKKTILAGAFEALIAAIYLDGGIINIKNFIIKLLTPFFKKLKGKSLSIDNYKSALQEYYQKRNLPPPVYQTIEEEGPDHKKIFSVEVLCEGKSLAQAKGRSKKSAEQKVAKKVLQETLGKRIRGLGTETFFFEKKRK
ncbi:MAG: ribonuclease III [Candidatus Aminicenantia bacterium]